MSELKNLYILTNREQLIDLNDESVNFDISFKVESTSKKEFLASIIDQNLLDENNYEYKPSINGEFEGQVIANKNRDFINYYLILKAIDNEPCEVIVTLNKQTIERYDEEKLTKENNKSFNILSILQKNWKYILVFVILTLLFLFFNKNQKLAIKDSENNSHYSPSNHSVSNSSVYSSSNLSVSNSSVSNSSVYSPSNRSVSNSSVYSSASSIPSLYSDSSN